MNRKLRHAFALLLIFALTVSLTAACSSGNANRSNNSGNSGDRGSDTASTPTPAPAAETPAPAPEAGLVKPQFDDTPVKLTFWYALSGANGEAFAALIDDFNRSQSVITVEATYSGSYADTAAKMAAALASKTEPNGALMAAAPLYTGPQNNTRLIEMIQSEDFDMSDIYDGMWDYVTYNGKISAIPFNISTQLLYYNKDLLTKAGIDVSKAPATWDDLYDYAKKVVEYGQRNNIAELAGVDTSDTPWLFKALLMQNGNPVVEASGDAVTPLFDNAKGVETAEFWHKLVADGLMPAGQHDLAEKKFLSGNLGMLLATSARTSRWASGLDIEVGAFPLPAKERSAVPLGGAMLVQFNKSEREDWATYELVKYLISTEVSTKFALDTGYLPIHKSGLELPEAKEAMAANPLYKTAFDQLQNSWAYWNFDEMGSMDFMIYYALERIEKGEETPEEAMKSLTAELKSEMGVN